MVEAIPFLLVFGFAFYGLWCAIQNVHYWWRYSRHPRPGFVHRRSDDQNIR